MTLVAYLAGDDKAHKVSVGDMGLTTRADGSPGFGSIIFDDPDKSLTVRGWMKVVVHETACTDAPILFSGYVGPRRYSRTGPNGTYKSGGSRYIDTTLVDENAVLGIRLITEPDGKRPAESHNDRIAWLLASDYLDGLIESDDLVDTSHPRPFEEADYRDQFPDNVLEDIAGPIFRTFFVFVDGATGDRILFFDTPTATVGTSDLSISNVIDDVDNETVFFPFLDGDQVLDPSEVVALDRYRYAKGVVNEHEDDTKATFFTDNGLGYRGRADNNTRIGSEASARIMAQGILERNSEENETLTVRLILPKDKVGLIRAGQRIQGTFTHLDGWESGKFSRITECTVTQWNQRTDLYLMQLELNSHGLASGGGGGAPGPGEFPHPPTSEGGHWYEFDFTTDVLGSIMGGIGIASMETGYSSPAETTVSSTNTVGAVFEPFTVYNYFISATGVAGGGAGFWDYGIRFSVAIHPGYPSNVGSTFSIWTDGDFGAGDLTRSGSFAAPSDTSADPRFMSVSIAKSGGSPDHAVRVAGWIDPVGWDAGDTDPGPPSPAQPVGPENVTMDGADGTTTYPFADGSLRVFVDNTDQTAAISAQDGAAGTFTLAFTPTVTEHVVVFYLGR